jgi:hypothetical protein
VRSRTPRGIGAVAILVSVAVLASCGVREDEDPRILTDGAVPAELAEPAPASTIPQESSSPQRIYVIETRANSEEELIPYLVPMARVNEGDDYHRRVIEELVSFRPPEDETYSTAIPPTTGVLDVRLVDGGNGEQDVLEINLNQLEVSGGTLLKLAIAQMVFTATAIPGVRGVRFLLNGSPVAVPLDVGESETGAVVTSADFPSLSPKTSSSTTTPPPADPVPGELGPEEPVG